MNKELKQNFKKPLLVLLLFAQAFFLSGFDFPEEPEESQENRVLLEESLQLERNRPAVGFEVFRGAQERRRIWNVIVTSMAREEDALCRTTLPVEAGERGYEVSLQHHPGDGGARHVVLLTAQQGPSGSKVDPPTFQIAFLLEPHQGPGRWRCSVIARGEHTQLDGGVRFEFDEQSTPARLLRFDGSAQPRFCGLSEDERPGYERFDDQSGRFAPASDPDVILEGATLLMGQLPKSALSPPLIDNFFTWIIASSDIRGAPVGANPPRPLALGDQDRTTAWIEGARGIGEFVSATVSTSAAIEGVQLFPGHQRDRASFEGYGRPRSILLALEEGQRFIVELREHTFEELEAFGGLYVEFPEPIRSRCLSVMILDKVDGTLASRRDAEDRRRGRAVAVGSILLYSTLDGSTETETAQRLLEAIQMEPSLERRDRLAALGALIPGELAREIEVILKEKDSQARLQVLPALAQLPGEISLPILRDHLLRLKPEDEDYRLAKRTLAAFGPSSAPILLELLDYWNAEENERKVVDTLRLLGRVGSTVQLLRLIDGLGTGSEMLRRERARSIAAGGVAMIPRLMTQVTKGEDRAPGFDALMALIFIGQRHFNHEPSEFDGTPLFEAHQRGQSRAFRIRLLEAMTYYHFQEGVEMLGAEILGSDPDPVVRQFAARALRHYAGDRALDALVMALSDPSPDVRIAAIRTLNHHTEGLQRAGEIADYLAAEQWPRALHHGFQLLARTDDPEALEKLYGIISKEIASPVGTTAMRALRRYQRSLPMVDLARLLREETTPHGALRQLVDMLGHVDSPLAKSKLIAIADEEYAFFQNRPPEIREDLATRALLAMGQRDSPVMGAYLLEAALDSNRSERDRGVALRSLGFIKDRESLETLQAQAGAFPPALRRQYRETLGMMRSRIAIEETGREIDQIRETLREEEERRRED